MAQQVLPIIGAVVGGYFGGPSGAQAGWAIGAAVGGAVAASEPTPGPSLGELPVQTSYEGSPRAIIYGTATCTGYVLAFSDPIKTTEIETGDKGAPKSENEVVYRSYAIAICEGPIKAVLRVWENDKLVYDLRAGTQMLYESAKWLASGGGTTFYLGGEQQVPDIFMALNVSGLGETPGYSGTAYMFRLLSDTTDTRGAIPQYRFEVAVDAERFIGEVLNGPTISNGPYFGVSEDKLWAITSRDASTNWDLGLGKAYTVTLYDELFNPQEDVVVTNQGTDFSPGVGYYSHHIDGHAIGDSSGRTVLQHFGLYKAWYVPYDSAPNDWRDNEGSYYPGYGSLIWHDDATVYIGVRKGGSGGGTSWNSIYRFPTSLAVGKTVPVQAVAGVSTGSEPVFWMHLSRQGDVRAIDIMGVGKKWSGALADEEIWDVPDAIKAFIVGKPGLDAIQSFFGFGVDTAMNMAVYVVNTVPVSVHIYDLSGNLLDIKSIGAPTDRSSPTRVLFAENGVYVARAWKLYRIDAPPTYLGESVPLSSIVSDLHKRCGLDSSVYDVFDLTGINVRGLTLQSEGYSAADAISTLQDCYFFDKQEDGEQIKYPLRGKAVVTTLTIDDVVDVPDLSKREQAGEIPRKMNLMYQNSLAGYAPVKATFSSSSPDNKSTLEITTQVAVVLDVDEAQQMVHKVFKVAVANAQGEIKLSVPDVFIRLTPGDCIGLSLRGRVIRLRITEIEWADGVLNLTCRTDRQSAYTSVLTGIPIPEPTLPPSTIAGDTQFAYLDIPARIDSEDDLHYLVAGTSPMPGWYGWALQRSLDAGLNFSMVDTWNDRAIMGTLVDPVDAASEHYTDTTNTVRVQLYRTTQVIESQTEQQFLSEGGAFAIVRPDGSAEVMQYLDADDEGDGVFALTTLHRGLLNTVGSAHLEGALFVLLSSAKHVTAQSAWLGMDLTHRAVSLGESPESADIQTDTFVGRSQIEWPVAHLTVERDLSDVLTVSWLPRHRFGSDVNPIASVNFQGFRVTFDDGATSVSFDTTGTTYVYNASAMGSSVEVSVAPINRITGLGPVESVIA